jgi:hypothetical protein
MSTRFFKIILVIMIISMPIYAKKKSWTSKVFSSALDYSIDLAKEDLAKGDESEIIQYYKKMKVNNKEAATNRVDISDSVIIENENMILRNISNNIELLVTYPKSVRAGDIFILKVIMVNKLENATMGGVTLSFPQYSNIQGAVISQHFDSVQGYMPPQKMYSGILKKRIKINYFVMEGWENNWFVGTDRYMELALTAPEDTNLFDINIRSILVLGKGKSKIEFTNPTNANSSNMDQQGYFVKKIQIEIQKPEKRLVPVDSSISIKGINREGGVVTTVIEGNGEKCYANMNYKNGYEGYIIKTSCRQITNSKGVKILCTKNKRICKTMSEISALLQQEINMPTEYSHSRQLTPPPINIRQDMGYTQARKILINNGWQSTKNRWQDMAEKSNRVQYFYYKQKWQEIDDCAGTGMGYCDFNFHDAIGNQLRVVTIGESDNPLVDSWSLVQ